LDIINEHVNSEACALLGYYGFLGKNVDEA